MYILECADGSYYTGSTTNIELRLLQHQNGEGSNHTRKRLPVKLLYFEEFMRIDNAFVREKQVQGWCRKKKEALINNITDELHELAKCLNETSHTNYDFDSASFGSAQLPGTPRCLSGRLLSEAEGSQKQPTSQTTRSLSGAEGSEGNQDHETKTAKNINTQKKAIV